jgi:hypothetical protein
MKTFCHSPQEGPKDRRKTVSARRRRLGAVAGLLPLLATGGDELQPVSQLECRHGSVAHR